MHLPSILLLASALVISASPAPAAAPASAQLSPRATTDQVYLKKCGYPGRATNDFFCDGKSGQGGLLVNCRPDDTAQLFTCGNAGCQCTKTWCTTPTCPNKKLYKPQPDVASWLYKQTCYDLDGKFCSLDGHMYECNKDTKKMRYFTCSAPCKPDCPENKPCTPICKNAKPVS